MPGSWCLRRRTTVPLDDFSQWWTGPPGPIGDIPKGRIAELDGPRESSRGAHRLDRRAWPMPTGPASGCRAEAEWELAARGGLDREPYCWGHELRPKNHWQSNIWQGNFPNENTAGDGFRGTAPVGSYAPNGYGLFDMSGNVWEWCSDWYAAELYASGRAAMTKIHRDQSRPSIRSDRSRRCGGRRAARSCATSRIACVIVRVRGTAAGPTPGCRMWVSAARSRPSGSA